VLKDRVRKRLKFANKRGIIYQLIKGGVEMEFIILWLLFGIVCAAIASAKGRSGCGWFILGALLGPFALVVAFLPKIESPGLTKKCPHCAEIIKYEAEVCRYCGRELLKTVSKTDDYNFKGMSKEEAINMWKANSSDKRSWGEIVTLWEKTNRPTEFNSASCKNCKNNILGALGRYCKLTDNKIVDVYSSCDKFELLL